MMKKWVFLVQKHQGENLNYSSWWGWIYKYDLKFDCWKIFVSKIKNDASFQYKLKLELLRTQNDALTQCVLA